LRRAFTFLAPPPPPPPPGLSAMVTPPRRVAARRPARSPHGFAVGILPWLDGEEPPTERRVSPVFAPLSGWAPSLCLSSGC